MENTVRLPLSGAVSQTINPWEFWIRSFSSQMGFINIRNVTSSDHRIEQEVVEDVASYGRQLGRINDVLMTLIGNPRLENLSPSQEKAISDFQDMVSDIERVKKKWASPAQLLSILDTIVSEINELKSEHPDIYNKALTKIRHGLEVSSITNHREPIQPSAQGRSLSACE